jgi:hypothetical protein
MIDAARAVQVGRPRFKRHPASCLGISCVCSGRLEVPAAAESAAVAGCYSLKSATRYGQRLQEKLWLSLASLLICGWKVHSA